jgi:hypothetical protein
LSPVCEKGNRDWATDWANDCTDDDGHDDGTEVTVVIGLEKSNDEKGEVDKVVDCATLSSAIDDGLDEFRTDPNAIRRFSKELFVSESFRLDKCCIVGSWNAFFGSSGEFGMKRATVWIGCVNEQKDRCKPCIHLHCPTVC